MGINNVPRQVEPSRTRVQNDAVGRDVDEVTSGVDHFGIGIGHQFDLPIPPTGFRCFAEQRGQPPAVGDRLVEQPPRVGDSQLRLRAANQFNRRQSFFHLAIGAVHAGHVTIATIATGDDDRAGQRCFDGGQQVVSIDHQRPTRHILRGQCGRFPLRDRLVAGSAASNGHALARLQLVAIADQFQRSIDRVAM